MQYTASRILAAVTLACCSFSASGTERGAMVPTSDDLAVRMYENSHALVIGIDRYEHWTPLSNAVEDAKAVSAELESRGFAVTLKTNLESEELEDVLGEFVHESGQEPNDRLFLWFAGHGHTIDGKGYLVPADAPRAPGDVASPAETSSFRRAALSLHRVGELMDEVNAKHVLAIFDSCFSGSVFNTAGQRSYSPEVSHSIAMATALPVRQLISAGTAQQIVSDDGMFRKMFIDALNGQEPTADVDGDKYLTGTELGMFLSRKITNLTEGRQTPKYGKLRHPSLDRGDFVFVLQTAQPQLAREDEAWNIFEKIFANESESELVEFITKFSGTWAAKAASVVLSKLRESESTPSMSTVDDREPDNLFTASTLYAGGRLRALAASMPLPREKPKRIVKQRFAKSEQPQLRRSLVFFPLAILKEQGKNNSVMHEPSVEIDEKGEIFIVVDTKGDRLEPPKNIIDLRGPAARTRQNVDPGLDVAGEQPVAIPIPPGSDLSFR
jgi:hypothetical protein